jgi:hypothetical protein
VTVVEIVRRGASELNKRATITTCLFKKGELKSSSLLGKRQPATEKEDKKERIAYSNSG